MDCGASYRASRGRTKEQLKPYTMAEIDAMIDESEADFAAGRYYSLEESRKLRNAHLAELIK